MGKPSKHFPVQTLEKCEICSKLTIKTPERRYFTLFSSVPIVNIE